MDKKHELFVGNEAYPSVTYDGTRYVYLEMFGSFHNYISYIALQ